MDWGTIAILAQGLAGLFVCILHYLAIEERNAARAEVSRLKRENHGLLFENIQLSSKYKELRLGVAKFDRDGDGQVGGSLPKARR